LRAVLVRGGKPKLAGATRSFYRGGSRILRKSLILEVGPLEDRSFLTQQGAYFCLGPVLGPGCLFTRKPAAGTRIWPVLGLFQYK